MGGDLDRLLRQDSPPPRRNSFRANPSPSGGLRSDLNHTDVSLYASAPASAAKAGVLLLSGPSQSQSAPLASEHRSGSRAESSPEASLRDALDNPAIPSAPSWTAVNNNNHRLPPLRNIPTRTERPLSSLHGHVGGFEPPEIVQARQASPNALAQYRRHSPPRAEAGRGPMSTAVSVEVGHSRAVTVPSPISDPRQGRSASSQPKGPDTLKRALKSEQPSFRPQQHAFASTALSQASGFAVRDDHITTPPSPAPSPEVGSVIASPISAPIAGLEKDSTVQNLGRDLGRTAPFGQPDPVSSRPVIERSLSVNSTVKPQSKTVSRPRRRTLSVRFAEQPASKEMATSPNIAYLSAHAADNVVVPQQGVSSFRPPVPRPFDEMTSAGTLASAPEVVHGHDSGDPQRLLTEMQLNAAAEHQSQEWPGVFTSCSQCGESWTSPTRYLPPPTEISQLTIRLRESTKIRAELVDTWHANHQCRPQSAATHRTASSLSPPPGQESVSQTGKRKEQADPVDVQMSSKMHRVSVDSPSPHACQPSPPPEPSLDADEGYVTVWLKSSGDDPSRSYPVRIAKHVASLIGASVGAQVPQEKVKQDWTSMYYLHDNLDGRNKTTAKSSKDAVMTDLGNDFEGV